MESEVPSPVYQCVGIGVGPANLSLASLLHGIPDAPNLFLDRKEHFSWHDGQLLAGTELQVSMFKDLVTLADPTNSFSFLNYLHESGRIYHFINARFSALPRREFRNYLEWACRRNPNVVFGEQVLSVDFQDVFIVRTDKRVLRAENVVVGVGSQPWVPQAALGKLGPTQFHVGELHTRGQDVTGRDVCVVGGGQSGAEAFLDLLSRPPGARPRRLTWVSRRSGFPPIDDSPFTNDFYMPCYSDYFARLERGAREMFNARHVFTSDGISEMTLQKIYQALYLHHFVDGGRESVGLYPNRTVTEVTGHDAGWHILLAHNDDPRRNETITAELVVWATGLQPAATDFLEPIAGRLQREDKEYLIDRDFAVLWDGPRENNIFFQNAARQQRGLADVNLSLNAWRSQRIVDRLRGTRRRDQLPSFIQWSAADAGPGTAEV